MSVRYASNTMSCDAEMKAVASASAPSSHVWSRGDIIAMAAIDTARATCVTRSQPRRRPRNGGTKRSIAGAQRNFHVYGTPASVTMPMVVRSTPSTVIHACSVLNVSARGRPEEKPRNVMTARLRSRKTAA